MNLIRINHHSVSSTESLKNKGNKKITRFGDPAIARLYLYTSTCIQIPSSAIIFGFACCIGGASSERKKKEDVKYDWNRSVWFAGFAGFVSIIISSSFRA